MSLFKELKIIDLSTVLAGPSVGTFFAELGAEVIKIESPKIPDVTRSWKLPTEDKSTNVSAYFSSVNYKKHYLEADLKNSEELEEVKQLICSADILLSNFKPGDDAKFGLTDSQLHDLNPSLIIGKINGFGTESDRVAYDLILQAETGFMSMNGTPESGPVKMPVALIDVLAAHHLKEGILISLLERERTGKGASISVSLYDAAVCSLMNQASNFLMENFVPQRIGSLHPNIAPYGELFTTADNALITFAIGSQLHFEKLCHLLECPELLNDKRFISNQLRVLNRTVLQHYLQEKVAKWNAIELLKSTQQLFIPCGKVKDLAAVFETENARKLVRKEIINGQETSRITAIACQWK
ncbi:MAG: hypothetical protein RL264_611 [Bacteroidota bacterium]|jgi:crotonobetainyl-CoA:carnitine CoA-transferase CaiB-like acyl-CoA transferase